MKKIKFYLGWIWYVITTAEERRKYSQLKMDYEYANIGVTDPIPFNVKPSYINFEEYRYTYHPSEGCRFRTDAINKETLKIKGKIISLIHTEHKSLRRGNLLKHPDGEIMKVVEIDKFGVTLAREFNSDTVYPTMLYESIELTKELVVSLGFYKLNSGTYMFNEHTIIFKESVCYYKIGANILVIPYVHTLQNICFIIGKYELIFRNSKP